MDACFYHSKHKYNENEKYKLLPIDLDENSKNVLYFLKEKIHKAVNTWFPYSDNFFWIVLQGGEEVVMSKQKLYLFY